MNFYATNIRSNVTCISKWRTAQCSLYSATCLWHTTAILQTVTTILFKIIITLIYDIWKLITYIPLNFICHVQFVADNHRHQRRRLVRRDTETQPYTHPMHFTNCMLFLSIFSPLKAYVVRHRPAYIDSENVFLRLSLRWVRFEN